MTIRQVDKLLLRYLDATRLKDMTVALEVTEQIEHALVTKRLRRKTLDRRMAMMQERMSNIATLPSTIKWVEPE